MSRKGSGGGCGGNKSSHLEPVTAPSPRFDLCAWPADDTASPWRRVWCVVGVAVAMVQPPRGHRVWAVVVMSRAGLCKVFGKRIRGPLVSGPVCVRAHGCLWGPWLGSRRHLTGHQQISIKELQRSDTGIFYTDLQTCGEGRGTPGDGRNRSLTPS